MRSQAHPSRSDLTHLITDRLMSGTPSRLDLARSVYDRLGRHDYGAWEEAVRYVDEYCSDYTLDLPSFRLALTWAVLKSIIVMVAVWVGMSHLYPLIPMEWRMLLDGILIGVVFGMMLARQSLRRNTSYPSM